jgi:hypothetical protein
MSLRSEICEDLVITEEDLGLPSFTWLGNSYTFIPSITEFNRDLETGGFQLVRLLTATVRIFNYNDDTFEPLFPTGLPQPQQIINYTLDGTNYRVESVKLDPTNSYFRLVAHSTTRGI